MLNPRLQLLPSYPFRRLNALLGHVDPGKPPIDLSIGEPRHAPPALLARTLADHAEKWRGYPPIAGIPRWKNAVSNWLKGRYNLPEGMIGPENVIPASGTRETLYMIGQLLLADQDEPSEGPRFVLLPDPTYLPYLGAALMNGAQPWAVPAVAEDEFLPSYANVGQEVWERVSLVYVCSPTNPQGALVSQDLWIDLIQKARRYNAVLVADECYSEIYDQAPPIGALEACARLDGDLKNVLVVNSLSKRSSAAGLRSGFVAGDPALIEAFLALRAYGAAGMPVPVQEASAALWDDEIHVAENRELYRRKIDIAEDILGSEFGFFRPPGGFFLWLDVSEHGETGEAFARRLWASQGVRVLPGSYMNLNSEGRQPDRFRLRVALVHDEDTLAEALMRLKEALNQ